MIGHDYIKDVDEPTSTAMLRLIQGFWLSRALSIVVRLGIADLLKDGPMTVDDLARTVNAHAPSLYRVLRALAGEGLFTEHERGRFSATPLSALLQTGTPGSLRAFVLEQLDD